MVCTGAHIVVCTLVVCTQLIIARGVLSALVAYQWMRTGVLPCQQWSYTMRASVVADRFATVSRTSQYVIACICIVAPLHHYVIARFCIVAPLQHYAIACICIIA